MTINTYGRVFDDSRKKAVAALSGGQKDDDFASEILTIFLRNSGKDLNYTEVHGNSREEKKHFLMKNAFFNRKQGLKIVPRGFEPLLPG